jgi:hypothetical protein
MDDWKWYAALAMFIEPEFCLELPAGTVAATGLRAVDLPKCAGTQLMMKMLAALTRATVQAR